MKSNKGRDNKFKSLRFLILSCVFGFLFFAFALNNYAQDKIVAIVNSEVITQKDLDDFVNLMRIQMAQEYAEKDLEDKVEAMKEDFLGKLVEDRLMLQEARKNKIEIDENRIQGRMDQIKKSYPSESVFQEALLSQGLTQADIEKKIKEQMLIRAIIDRQIREKVKVMPAEVTAFYEENTGNFMLPAEREFESVTAKNLALAEEFFGKIKKGEDFYELVSQYDFSTNIFRASKNGELKKEIEQAVFALHLGEVSKPVKIDEKYYIFRLKRVISPRQQSLSEVQDEINNYLFNKKMQVSLGEWLDELKKQSYIKVFPE
ncbi:MAG: SurA N-terminal domain-containing protein [Candidatus Omnitrophica bacterium]|nr:SurA N-terminal domain-containing protein [Candidatus Omnitrophota bacterium]